MTLPESRFHGECLVDFPFDRPDGPVRGRLALVHKGAFDFIERNRATYLFASEEEALSSLKIERRRRTYLMGRYALKRAASDWTGLPPGRLETVAAILEYPILKAPVADVPDLTLTHTDGAAICLAVEAGHATGIDLEPINPARLATYDRVTTPRERDASRNLALDAPSAAVLYWSLREALSKAVRCGFTVPFEVLELEALHEHGDGLFRATFRNFGQYAGHAWIRDGHVFAVVHPKKSVPQPGPEFWKILRATGCFPKETDMLESPAR
ncbi:MAG: 4'-phosphopantetheinyl transferase superfamily protein [Spirochaetes bacterium]|nr:4'-phosphopantetheinyl transferase superfamily protein [Spirochaetota bacterium]